MANNSATLGSKSHERDTRADWRGTWTGVTGTSAASPALRAGGQADPTASTLKSEKPDREKPGPADAPVTRACKPTQPRSPSNSSSRSEEHTSELQSLRHLVCRLLLEKKK